MAFAAPLLALAGGGSAAAGGLALAGAAGSVVQGIQQKNAADANARIQAQEGAIAAAQGYSAEATQRRQGTMALGRETAAVGQAGGGYGGSAGRVLDQSATNAELDALNVRYKAGLQKWGYDTQSSLTQREGSDELGTSFALAGTKLLQGYSKAYQSPGQYALG